MRHFIAALIVALVFFPIDSPSSDEENILPGRNVSINEAIQKSSDIVVGELKLRGGIDDGPPGVFDYFHGKVQVDRLLHGKADGELVCNYQRRVSPEALAEQEPVAGKRYIIFLKHAAKLDYNIIKFVAFSDDQLLAISKIIDNHTDRTNSKD